VAAILQEKVKKDFGVCGGAKSSTFLKYTEFAVIDGCPEVSSLARELVPGRSMV